MPALKHLHTYRRNRNMPNIYQCEHPECSHYIDRKWIVGKKSICKCGREFILTSPKLRNAQPRCDFCSKGKGAKEFQKASSIMDLILENEGMKKKEEEIKDESISTNSGD